MSEGVQGSASDATRRKYVLQMLGMYDAVLLHNNYRYCCLPPCCRYCCCCYRYYYCHCCCCCHCCCHPAAARCEEQTMTCYERCYSTSKVSRAQMPRKNLFWCDYGGSARPTATQLRLRANRKYKGKAKMGAACSPTQRCGESVGGGG